MTFFYDLNKRLADIAKKQDLTESVGTTSGFLEGSTGDYSAKKARAGKDIGKPGKMFSKIAKSAGEKYGSKERGEKVAGAVLAKLRAKESVDEANDHKEMKLIRDLRAKGLSDKEIRKEIEKIKSGTSKHMPKEPSMDESALQAYLGKKKYGETGMKALQKAGREGASKETMAKIRARHDKMDEADMDEGNEFSGELVKARAQGAKSFKVDGKEYPVKEGAKPDYIDLDKDGNKKESMKKAAKDAKKSKSSGTAFDPETAKGMFAHKDDSRYDVKDTGYSKRYTRKAEPEDEQDDEVKSDAPKKKGRPAGTKRAIGAKGPTGKSKLMKKGAIKEMDSVALTDKGEYDQEGDMAKDQLHTLVKAAKELHGILADDDNLPEWVQSKITKALDYINVANDYMDQERHDADEPIAEKAVSQQQQKFMGMVHAMQKGEKIKGASKELKKVAKEMPKKAAKDYAATKHAGLPKKVSETDAEPKAKKGGFEFGKGVYESMNKQYTQMLNEGMNISVNMNTDAEGKPSKNITVSADGDDAEALAALLKMAGMGAPKQEACPTCGSANCGCEEELDENSPDWPTNTETSDDAMQYSGGLNGPKSTGQTTTPVIASQLRRQVSMEESVELERSLFKLYQAYKGK